MSALVGLQCHLCKTVFPLEALYVCDRCLGPLEPVYDYAAVRLTREEIERRPKNLWRYRELLPIVGQPRTGFHSGFTPLVRCDRLADRLGVQELYVKDDSVNHPTLSYKDRVVSVAATRALELGFKVLACASTGNLANSVAAHAARLGVECCVFIPDDLEAGKLLGSAVFNPTILAIAGNYDDVNRLCTQVGDQYGWGFVNINLRSYYAEGAKTFGFEIVEQLGWRYPKHVVAPVAGGTLLPRILRGFRELREVGLVDGELPRMYAAQAAGCAPVVRAIDAGIDHPEPAEVGQYLDRVRDAFNVNSLAQWAAVAALYDRAHVERTLAVVAEGRELLTRELPRFGFRVVPSAANFVLCALGRSGKEFFEALLPHGVIVRPLDAYRMPQSVRISVGTARDNQRLLHSIDRVMAGNKVPAVAP